MSDTYPHPEDRHTQLMSWVFERKYYEEAISINWSRNELALAADFLRIPLPKNLGDAIYTVRYRTGPPK